MMLVPFQSPPDPPQRPRGCALTVTLAVIFVGLLAVVVLRPARAALTSTATLTTLVAPRTATPLVVQMDAGPTAAPLPDQADRDSDVPFGSPLGPRGVVMTQGYGVGSHTPAAVWGAVDLAIDGNGDGQADARATDGAPIYATMPGVVTVTPNSVPAGNHVWVANTHYKTGYAHLKSFAPGLASGQIVERGTLIGAAGATGQASGPHLDYQVWRDGVNVNPLDYGALPAPTGEQTVMSNKQATLDADPVQLVQRDVGDGHLAAIIVRLGANARVAVVTADNARQSTDATGDTVWADGGQHLRTVREMTSAPYAQQDGWRLRGGINFGFFGARTSDEGTVMVDGVIRHVNAGRAAVCLTADGDAQIGLFQPSDLAQCVQAFGAGPVVMLNKQIAGADLPFNPLDEDFAEADWRRAVYEGKYAKTTIGIGRDAGGSFLVLAVAWELTGVELGRALIALGVSDAVGGDDDTSSQMTWDGLIIRDGQAVPDMVAVYSR